MLDEIRDDLVEECRDIKYMDLESMSKEELVTIINNVKAFMTNRIKEIDSELEDNVLYGRG